MTDRGEAATFDGEGIAAAPELQSKGRSKRMAVSRAAAATACIAVYLTSLIVKEER